MLAGFYFDKSSTLVEPHKFRRNLKHNIFSYKGFWRQILISFYEGTVCYFLVVNSFSGAVDYQGRTVDDTAIGTLLFLVVLNIVNLKL
jgi:magnesium-transporting ATPase (P-type)